MTDAVRRYARVWQRRRRLLSPSQAYVPLSFDPSEAYQFRLEPRGRASGGGDDPGEGRTDAALLQPDASGLDLSPRGPGVGVHHALRARGRATPTSAPSASSVGSAGGAFMTT